MLLKHNSLMMLSFVNPYNTHFGFVCTKLCDQHEYPVPILINLLTSSIIVLGCCENNGERSGENTKICQKVYHDESKYSGCIS